MHLLYRAAFCLGTVWAAPITLPAVIIGLLAIPFGARLRISDSALVFHHFPLGPGGAMTLGNVILHTGASLDTRCLTYASQRDYLLNPLCDIETVRLGDHERAHVYQYLVLGVFFLVVYFLLGGINAKNPLEQAADTYAKTGSGWWPWH